MSSSWTTGILAVRYSGLVKPVALPPAGRTVVNPGSYQPIKVYTGLQAPSQIALAMPVSWPGHVQSTFSLPWTLSNASGYSLISIIKPLTRSCWQFLYCVPLNTLPTPPPTQALSLLSTLWGHRLADLGVCGQPVSLF